jgi:hypothetical protein
VDRCRRVSGKEEGGCYYWICWLEGRGVLFGDRSGEEGT